MSRNRMMSLYAQQRQKRACLDAPTETESVDAEALYMVEQCAKGAYTDEVMFVSTTFLEALRDAAFMSNIDFGKLVAPHFCSLHEYDRCIYTALPSPGECLMLVFDKNNHAFLTILGMSRVAKLVGRFAYDVCPERECIRLRDVGMYSEALLQPIEKSNNAMFIIPEINFRIAVTNQTPHNLRIAPALPSYFDDK